jgi:hypothetical protein
VKATVAERTRRQQAGRQGVPRQGMPGHGHPAGMAHPATRLRLVADGGRLLLREQVVPRRPLREQVVPRRPLREQVVPRRPPRERVVPREPARRVTARPGRIPYNPVPERTPIRLTRRGRVVITAAVVLLVGAVSLALVLWVLRG